MLAAYFIALQAILGVWGGYAHAAAMAARAAPGIICGSGSGAAPDEQPQRGCDCGALCAHRSFALLAPAMPAIPARPVWRLWQPPRLEAGPVAPAKAPGTSPIRGPPGMDHAFA
jgi:hypothetical protein